MPSLEWSSSCWEAWSRRSGFAAPNVDAVSDYVGSFHAAHPGITEAVLRRCRDHGTTPYEWLLAAVPDGGPVLDLACGSAPMWPALCGRPYIGVDTCPAELEAAKQAGAGALLRASATRLPLAPDTVRVVVASMALTVVQPLSDALAECHRVLVPGARLVATLPATRPLQKRDLPIVAGLLVALGGAPRYPNDRLTPRLRTLLHVAGFRIDSDESRRFGYVINEAADADLLLESLYLPGLSPARYRWAGTYLRALAKADLELPVPIRRVVATADVSKVCQEPDNPDRRAG